MTAHPSGLFTHNYCLCACLVLTIKWQMYQHAQVHSHMMRDAIKSRRSDSNWRCAEASWLQVKRSRPLSHIGIDCFVKFLQFFIPRSVSKPRHMPVFCSCAVKHILKDFTPSGSNIFHFNQILLYQSLSNLDAS